MKPQGAHPDRALNAAKLRSLSKPGRYADGNGLYLLVDRSGAKRWLLRTMVLSRRRDIGLGSASLVSLAEAREIATGLRKIARDGGDPLAVRRKARTRTPSFAEAAEKVHAEHCAGWKNTKHKAQWLSTLRKYAFPVIGRHPVDHIETPDVLRVLSPIWLTRPETARRVRQRIGTVLDWAKTAGFREGENPVGGVAKGLPRQPERNGHFAAMPYADIPAFLDQLKEGKASQGVKFAFELLILTAARSGEIRGARWEEFDLEEAIWTIPADRMKKGREHRVPLSGAAIALMRKARPLSQKDGLVFPGRAADVPMSENIFTNVLKRMRLGYTAHGFRSAFRDWAAERTNVPREVCEEALAHVVRNKTEAAYRRGDLFDKRRDLMESWADHLAHQSAKVIPLRTG